MKTSHIIIGIIIILLAFILFQNSPEENVQELNTSSEIETTTLKDSIEIENEGISEASEIKTGIYEDWSPEKLSLAKTNDVIIFFHASWCPSCRGLNNDIEENILSIPEGVAILKADYDTESELKRKYEVTTQHTLVQVDAEGNLIKKWSGGSKLEGLLEKIQ